MEETPKRERMALDMCGCGRFHLTYGALTLHFEPGEFLAFAGDIAQVVAQLRRAPDSAVRTVFLSHKTQSFH
ncbi:MAG: hypothetical protein ACREJU_18970 [Nitrospiraceae bacterium]